MPLRSIASLPRLLGRQGAEAPTGPAPVIDRARVEGLVRLSLAGLEAMHDPARELLFSVTLEEGDQPVRVEHLGVRYTVMSSLGIHDARQAGFATTLDPIRLLQSGLDQHPGDDIDHLGMALWADADVGAGISKAVVPRLLAALDKPLDGVIGRAVSWALIGLCRYREQAGADARVDAAARRLRDHGLAGWHEAGGLFNHFAGGSAFLRTQALFSTQIYWVYALATHGRVFGDAEALRVAGKCADTLIALRDPFGGWPWRYDAPRGRVTERYPVYSVHQDAMAPMALHVLAEATGREVAAVNRESLAWLWRNELGLEMVDSSHQVIYRAIRRQFPLNRAAYALGWATAYGGVRSPVADRPWALRLNATCRPYHLGWLLHAWAGRLDRVEDGLRRG